MGCCDFYAVASLVGYPPQPMFLLHVAVFYAACAPGSFVRIAYGEPSIVLPQAQTSALAGLNDCFRRIRPSPMGRGCVKTPILEIFRERLPTGDGIDRSDRNKISQQDQRQDIFPELRALNRVFTQPRPFVLRSPSGHQCQNLPNLIEVLFTERFLAGITGFPDASKPPLSCCLVSLAAVG